MIFNSSFSNSNSSSGSTPNFGLANYDMSSDLTLDSTAPLNISINPSASNLKVILPDVSTLENGRYFIITNNSSSYSPTVYDTKNNVLSILPINRSYIFTLLDKATGHWMINKYNDVSIMGSILAGGTITGSITESELKNTIGISDTTAIIDDSTSVYSLLCKVLSSNQIIVVYTKGMFILTFEENTFTKSEIFTFSDMSSSYKSQILVLSETSFILSYIDYNSSAYVGYINIYTISGNKIILKSSISIPPTGVSTFTALKEIKIINLIDLKFLAIFLTSSPSYILYATIFTISSNYDNISRYDFFVVNTLSSTASSSNISLAYISDSKILITYQYNGIFYCQLAFIRDNVITFGTSTTLNLTNFRDDYKQLRLSNGKIFIPYITFDSSFGINYKIIEVNNNDEIIISDGKEIINTNDSFSITFDIIALTSSKFILVCGSSGNNYNKAKVFELSENDINLGNDYVFVNSYRIYYINVIKISENKVIIFYSGGMGSDNAYMQTLEIA